ncbi:MAG: hypothetical protein IT581_17580 [Verrucomicrobiales bacterium]|nr:hypothetical protein [Verrucomicrobiales bacterium]
MNPEANQPVPEVTEAEETQLCLSCLAPNPVLGHFCRQCGAPISPYAVTAPFESAYAEGFALRRAVESPKNRVVLGGVLAYAASMAAIGLVILLTSGPEWNVVWLLGLGLVVFGAALGTRALLHWRRGR